MVGTYSIQNSMNDVYWMLGLGVCGYFLKRYGFQIGPVILGCILGPIIDMNFRRAILSVQGSPSGLAIDFVSNPITLVLTIATLALLVSQTAAMAALLRTAPGTEGGGEDRRSIAKAMNLDTQSRGAA